jgi:hypothetical protein
VRIGDRFGDQRADVCLGHRFGRAAFGLGRGLRLPGARAARSEIRQKVEESG